MSDQPFHPYDSTASTKDDAVEETRSVGHDAKEGARHVAQTAGAEAQAVVGEARAQVTSLYDQVRQDVTGQARDQTQRAATGLHGLAGEFTELADGTSPGSGMASELARQAAQRIDAAAGWLEGREPADLLEEVRRYARRSPGTFLAACAVVGFVGGRLTRGLRDDAQDRQQAVGQGSSTALVPAAPAPPPQPMEFGSGYGGRPGAAPEGSVTAGMAGGVAAGTAAGNPLPAGPAGAEPLVHRDTTAPIVAGDGEDVYTDPDQVGVDEPWTDPAAPGQDTAADRAAQEQGGDRW